MSRPNLPGIELNQPCPGMPGITPGMGVTWGKGMGIPMPIAQGANMLPLGGGSRSLRAGLAEVSVSGGAFFDA